MVVVVFLVVVIAGSCNANGSAYWLLQAKLETEVYPKDFSASLRYR